MLTNHECSLVQGYSLGSLKVLYTRHFHDSVMAHIYLSEQNKPAFLAMVFKNGDVHLFIHNVDFNEILVLGSTSLTLLCHCVDFRT